MAQNKPPIAKWWKKSCTTWDVSNPVNNGIYYLSTGAGYLPSTVSITSRYLFKSPRNHLVYEAVKDGTLPPGCEEDDSWSCRWKFGDGYGDTEITCQREKLGTHWRVSQIYTNIYHLYMGYVMVGVMFWEQLLGYLPKGTQNFPLNLSHSDVL